MTKQVEKKIEQCQMTKQVDKYIEKYQMIEEEDTIIVGVSGGADSICLLFVLLELMKEYHLHLHVVHINHGMRTVAVEEAGFVRSLCDKYNLPFYLFDITIKEIAAKQKISEEEAGREERYKAFHQILQKLGYLNHPKGKIAVAHNKNDRAETVLFNLFRGSGLKGLTGILPVRGQIIRPILCLERSQIEHYLQENELSYCIDQTNLEDSYTRNRIRNHILPYAEGNVCKNIIPHIGSTAEILDEIELYMQKQVKIEMEDCVSNIKKEYIELELNDCVSNRNIKQVQIEIKDCVSKWNKQYLEIEIAKFILLDNIIRKYIIKESIQILTGNTKEITACHITAINELVNKEVGKEIHLPNKIVGKRSYTCLIIYQEVCEDQREKLKGSELGSIESYVSEERVQTGSELERIESCSIESKGSELVTIDINGKRRKLYEKPVIPGNLEIKSGEKLEFTLFKKQNNQLIHEKRYTKWFDYDKIKESVSIRTREVGDYLIVNKKGNKKTLKCYMINEKILQEERDNIVLLADGSHIMWIMGYRISEAYKVDNETKQILQVEIKGEQENGRES